MELTDFNGKNKQWLLDDAKLYTDLIWRTDNSLSELTQAEHTKWVNRLQIIRERIKQLEELERVQNAQ